jgi:hypothetical protein
VVEIGVKLSPIGQDNFFSSAKVKKALGEKKRRALNTFGSLVRRTARQSIRQARLLNRKERRQATKAGLKVPEPRYEPSKPGEPPRTRQPGAPIKRILYGYEPGGGPGGGGNVLIGFGQIGGRKSLTPARLEKGGTIMLRGHAVEVLPRPTMAPALEKMRPRAALLFGDTL